ncbi:cation:proton antiporter [Agrobacterium pusense]|uniref:cation:proton antiporter n=2 Tax=Rhizobiaceae TaxID=82115 RepID=UPI00289D9890|nr:sodium:proton antiporter [Agrobacterium pusense]
MSIVANSLLVAGFLLAVIAAIQVVAAKGWLPESSLLAIVGLVLGASYVVIGETAPELAESLYLVVRPEVPAEAYLWIFLPPLLFQAAMTADVRNMMPDAAPILLLAVVAVFVATGLIGWSLAAVSGHAIAICLLLGAIVATTDPSAVIGIFRDLGAPARLNRLVEGESLLNDAAAIAIVGVLISAISGDPANAGMGAAARMLGFSFSGGILCGYAVGRGVVLLLPYVNRLPVAAATLTLAIPYPLYIAADQMLHASGVIAVVTAGLVISALGPTRLTPRNWTHLNVIWRQIAVLAGAVVFLLAAVQVPDLLSAMDGRDILYLAVVVVAALVARAVVMFGMLPFLNWAKLSRPVENGFKFAIVWGGLRGAVTLVLALAIAENPALAEADRRFVGALAAAFVLVSLFVNGLSLRFVIARLGLSTLSRQQQVLQRQAVLLSAAEVETAIAELADDFQLPADVAKAVQQEYQADVAVGAGADPFVLDEALTERERLSIGLVTLATREHALIPEYGSGVISVHNLDAMMRNTSQMIDAARQEGRVGYNRAAKMILVRSTGDRIAHVLAARLHMRWLLARTLADRFELIICRRTVLERLLDYNEKSLKRLIGERMTAVLEGILRARLAAVDEALSELRSEHADYTRALERRLLLLFALRRGTAIIESMKAESVISAEIAIKIAATLEAAWEANIRRPAFHRNDPAGTEGAPAG